jgi:flagellar biogenesis protein FliO
LVQKLSNGNIKVIESVAIAPGKLLQLIKVGQQIFLIAVTKETIVYLKEIDSNSIEIKINEIKKQDIIPFEEQLKKWMGNKKKN